jgi:hypothetical protein
MEACKPQGKGCSLHREEHDVASLEKSCDDGPYFRHDGEVHGEVLWHGAKPDAYIHELEAGKLTWTMTSA